MLKFSQSHLTSMCSHYIPIVFPLPSGNQMWLVGNSLNYKWKFIAGKIAELNGGFSSNLCLTTRGSVYPLTYITVIQHPHVCWLDPY